MKKTLIAAIIFGSSFSLSAAPTDVNQKVLQAFNKTFINVKDVKWSEYQNFYEVKFRQNEILTRVTYDPDGRMISTLRYYNEEQLPMLVLARVKERFSKQKVYGVTEESSEEGTYYHITLEDEKHWIAVKANIYGDLSIENKYRKG